MRIIESDTNRDGYQNYLLEKDDQAGTLILAAGLGPGRYRIRTMIGDRPISARDMLVVMKLINARTAPTEAELTADDELRRIERDQRA